MRAFIGGGGQITVAAPGIPPFVSALAQGAELKATGTYAVRHPVAMVAQAQITRCERSAGQKIERRGELVCMGTVTTGRRSLSRLAGALTAADAECVHA